MSPLRRNVSVLMAAAAVCLSATGCQSTAAEVPPGPAPAVSPTAKPAVAATAMNHAKQACTTIRDWNFSTDMAPLTVASNEALAAAQQDQWFEVFGADVQEFATKHADGTAALDNLLGANGSHAATERDAAAATLGESAQALDRAVRTCESIGVDMPVERQPL